MLETMPRTAETPVLEDFHPYSDQFRQDPYPHYRRILSMGGPVYWDYMEAHVVARHADATAVLADPRLTVEPPPAVAALLASVVPAALLPMQRTMLFADPPDHTRLRALVRHAFTPVALDAAMARGREVACAVLDDLEPGRQFDVVDDLAYPVALRIIGETMGVPAADLEMLKPWSQAMVPAADIPSRPGAVEGATEAYLGFDHYFGALSERLRVSGGQGLLMPLLAAEAEGVITQAELHAMAALIFVSGHDTLVGLIANALNTLLAHPDQFDLLRSTPELAGQAANEVLRFESPLQLATAGGGRWAAAPIEIAGRLIPEHSRVLTLVAAANRDPHVYQDPDHFDITRPGIRHLALGHGLHYCVGAALVKAQGRMVLEELARRQLQFEPVSDRQEWLPVFIQRRLIRLDLRVTGR
ncbi:cytochrome P450 [Streptomyces sp. So13.3]|uniref:cytochrome P450 n=1 Tax=Streptomyces TaxID=1883 RepID=UPI001106853A|nr:MULTISPECIES: cytochrome P450 [unclassified Streptomyces]MCZ4101597.1 cytochrome P450 [Streptomyces sp. H39-C1]QNA76348.1 cytochrome P450 [Streptomyces sp. So13.3]